MENIALIVIICVGIVVLGMIMYMFREIVKSMGASKFFRTIHKILFCLLILGGYGCGAKYLGVLPSAGYGGIVGGLGYMIKSILNNPMTVKHLYKSLSLTVGCCLVSCISVSMGELSDSIGIYCILIVITLLMCLYQIVHYNRHKNNE